jgi:hypothetical protein
MLHCNNLAAACPGSQSRVPILVISLTDVNVSFLNERASADPKMSPELEKIGGGK